MNQHPKYGVPTENRRDNSYKKRQRLYRLYKYSDLDLTYRIAGYYLGHGNSHYKWYSYHSKIVRQIGERRIRHFKDEDMDMRRPSFFKKIYDYKWNIL